MIRKILIANRGEIAVRIIKTCNKLSIKTVAVYSDIDKNSMFVKMADEAYALDGITSQETYLNISKILEIAQKSNCDAIHPGYGFLSENSEFATRVIASNITFIGPSADSILAMGMKSTAKRLMEDAGVSVLPGYHGDDNSTKKLLSEAAKIGYPLLIKAAAGGGGKGMRVVNTQSELLPALDAAKREATKSFANDKVILEKYLASPRHIEVQLFCDNNGNGVYLFERDCSVQRRYQKVIEEAPAPNISPGLREALGEQALLVAKTISYVGAGTVEFLVDGNDFYFMEMNTRLQVEHPVTEMITGLDLVELQIKTAEGKSLGFNQQDLSIDGTAIEVRVYAEDVNNNFLPASGPIKYLEWPNGENVRIDSGVQLNDEISIYYDPMVAKIIAHGKTRKDAIKNLVNALGDTTIIGFKHNISFLKTCLENRNFVSADLSTNFISDNLVDIFKKLEVSIVPEYIWIAAALYYNLYSPYAVYSKTIDYASRRKQFLNFRFNQKNTNRFKLNYLAATQDDSILSEEVIVEILEDQQLKIQAVIAGEKYLCTNLNCDNNNVSFTLNSTSSKKDFRLKIVCVGDLLYLYAVDKQYIINNKSIVEDDKVVHHKGVLSAPMHGTIVSVNVNSGTKVAQGDTLLILEAMKMEHAITAPKEGVVINVNFKQGDQVAEGAELLVME